MSIAEDVIMTKKNKIINKIKGIFKPKPKPKKDKSYNPYEFKNLLKEWFKL